MIQRIIVGTDGSAHATKAVTWAAGLAAALKAELLLVHVFGIDPAALPGGYVVLPPEDLARLRQDAQERLEGLWSDAARRAGARCRTMLLDGSAAGALMDIAEREQADLIVVGSRGRGGFAELLLGSVGHHLTQHARMPVTIVPDR